MAFSGALVRYLSAYLLPFATDLSLPSPSLSYSTAWIDTNGPQRLHHALASMHQARRAEGPAEHAGEGTGRCVDRDPDRLERGVLRGLCGWASRWGWNFSEEGGVADEAGAGADQPERLPCVGCITSAESVLITLQSHTEVLNFLSSNATSCTPKIPVVSIAPQSLASLAAALNAAPSSSSTKPSPPVTPRQVLRRVHAFLTSSLGFAHVFDTTFARHLALKEHVAEFLERREADARSGSGEGGEEGRNYLPMLASACPGWICYAEKAHAEMLPFISRTKSPQQVMGTLVKEWMGKKWGRSPDGIYHVTVMPCYDKKLEASRQDFYNEMYATRDVDCVITTGELDVMMREKGWDLGLPVPDELEPIPVQQLPPSEETHLPELLQHPGTSSGSYLHSIMAHLQQASPTPLTISVKMIRNADYEEYTLAEEDTGKVVFKGAKCYGFRNLQNIVRKVGKERGVRTTGGAAGRLGGRAAVRRTRLKAGVSLEERQYDYVEVMACPGGCVNGGGQLKPRVMGRDEEKYERNWEEGGVSVEGVQGAKWGDREWTRRVEEAYWMGASRELELEDDEVLERVLGELCGRRHELLRTSYRAVESEVVGLAVKW